MIYFLIISLGIWALGHKFSVPTKSRWILIACVYLVVLLVLVLSPETAQVMGGDLGEWIILGILIGAVIAYRQGLSHVKKLAADKAPQKQTGSFSTAELERYARHIILREIGGPGQKKIKNARVLVIGAGGLGSPALLYLAAAGVGTIGVIDDDVVEESNLQRQIAHSGDQTGVPKVHSAKSRMEGINPFVEIRPYHRRFTPDLANDLVGEYDLVLDGSDNFETRYLANAACLNAKTPLISAALTQWEGQISVFDPTNGGPCYRCVFPQTPAPGLVPSCAEAGVIGPLTGVLGSMMAVEAIKVITGAGEALEGRMLIYDALYGETRIIKLAKDPECPDCGDKHPS